MAEADSGDAGQSLRPTAATMTSGRGGQRRHDTVACTAPGRQRHRDAGPGRQRRQHSAGQRKLAIAMPGEADSVAVTPGRAGPTASLSRRRAESDSVAITTPRRAEAVSVIIFRQAEADSAAMTSGRGRQCLHDTVARMAPGRQHHRDAGSRLTASPSRRRSRRCWNRPGILATLSSSRCRSAASTSWRGPKPPAGRSRITSA